MNEHILNISKLNASINGKRILKDIELNISDNSITALIGPTGSGKSVLLRSINRLLESENNINNTEISGDLFFCNKNTKDYQIPELRQKIGMILPVPLPFPSMTIYENILSGFKLNSIKLEKQETDNIVQQTLIKTGLWQHFKDYLHKKTDFLTKLHQQQLCFARAIALNPKMLLLDEPTSIFNPEDTDVIINMIDRLKKDISILLATHDIAQAGKIADYVAIIYNGRIVEYGETKQVFTTPESKITEDYLMGKYTY